jgi:alkaline phosphatase D
MLGAEQEAWLDQRFATTTARWNAIAQQTVMTAMPIPVGATPVFNYDQWDGYVAARRRLLRSLVANQVRNPMVLSGDIHLAAAAAVRLDYEDPSAPDVAHEIVTTSISSRFDPDLLDLVEGGLAAASWTRYGNAVNRGYAVATVTGEEWRTEFRSVDVSVEQSAVATDFVDVVADRDPVVLPPDRPSDPPPTSSDDAGPVEAPAATPVPGRATYTG